MRVCTHELQARVVQSEPGRPRRIVIAGEEFHAYRIRSEETAIDDRAESADGIDSSTQVVFARSASTSSNVQRLEAWLATRDQQWWRRELRREQRLHPPKRFAYVRSLDSFVRHSYGLDDTPPSSLPCVACGGAVRFDFRGARTRDVLNAGALPPVEALCAACVASQELATDTQYATGQLRVRLRGRVFNAFGGAWLRSCNSAVSHSDDRALRTKNCAICEGLIEYEAFSMGMTQAALYYAGPMRTVCRSCADPRGVVFGDVARRETVAVIDGLTYRANHNAFSRNMDPRWAHLYTHDQAAPAQ